MECSALPAVQRCLRPEIPNTTVPMQSRLQAAEIINTARGSLLDTLGVLRRWPRYDALTPRSRRGYRPQVTS